MPLEKLASSRESPITNHPKLERIIKSLEWPYRTGLPRSFWRLHHPKDAFEARAAHLLLRIRAYRFAPSNEHLACIAFRAASNSLSADAKVAKRRWKRSGQHTFQRDVPQNLLDLQPHQEEHLARCRDCAASLDREPIRARARRRFLFAPFDALTSLWITTTPTVAIKTVEKQIAESKLKFLSAGTAVS